MTEPEPSSAEACEERSFGFVTAMLLVVANMVGVGVFTTTGYFLQGVGSPSAVLFGWFLGGVSALCGGLCYAELGAAFPRNGGEYQLLSRIYHPALGFIAGWASLIVGFSAPMAAAALAFGTYLSLINPAIPPVPSALCLTSLLAGLHMWHLGAGTSLQNAFTIQKILLMALFIGVGVLFCDPARITVSLEALPGSAAAEAAVKGQSTFWGAVLSGQFAVGLLFVSYAYAGWNSVVYTAGEIRHPERNIPLALLIGTLIVTILYVGVNFVFLAAAPAEDLAAAKEGVGHVASISLFGPKAGTLLSLMIVIGLVSTVGSFIVTGPRVLEQIGLDYPALRLLTKRRPGGGPVVAILLQASLAAILMVTGSFETLLQYAGFTLTLFSALTVLGVFVMRIREPDLPRPCRTWGYPLTPLLFLALDFWIIVFSVKQSPVVAQAGAATLISGYVVYRLVRPAPPREPREVTATSA